MDAPQQSHLITDPTLRGEAALTASGMEFVAVPVLVETS